MAIDLFCGLGGWAEGFLSEDYDVVGFDNGHTAPYAMGAKYPGQLVLQDVLTIHGSQFKDATVIVCSPPCQEFSYRAMPWKIARAEKPDPEPEWWKLTEDQMSPAQLQAWDIWQEEHPLPPPDLSLFNACFRIQREASEAAWHHIPMVVENVRGIQKYVGKSQAKFGSYHLYGDVGMVGRRIVAGVPKFGQSVKPFKASKNSGGSWFAVAHNTTSGHSHNAREDAVEGQKVPGFHFDGSGRSLQSASVNQGIKNGHPERSYRNGHKSTAHLTNAAEHGTKIGGDWFSDPNSTCPKHGSRSQARRMASAQIAKIPFPLAQYIARAFKP